MRVRCGVIVCRYPRLIGVNDVVGKFAPSDELELKLQWLMMRQTTGVPIQFFKNIARSQHFLSIPTKERHLDIILPSPPLLTNALPHPI